MRYLRLTIATLFLLLFGFVTAAHADPPPPPAAGAATPSGSLFGRLRRVGGAAGVENLTTETSFAEIVGKIINGAMALLGVIFVAQMVYAGYLWMTASGEEEQLTKAKNIIRRSIVGLAIVLAAWAITTFVLSRLTAATGVVG